MKGKASDHAYILDFDKGNSYAVRIRAIDIKL